MTHQQTFYQLSAILLSFLLPSFFGSFKTFQEPQKVANTDISNFDVVSELIQGLNLELDSADIPDYFFVEKLVALDRENHDLLGQSVDFDGKRMIVGAHFSDTDSSGGNFLNTAGAAYIFEKDLNGDWVLAAKLVADDRSHRARFGFSVSISGDNALVGAPWEDFDRMGVDSLLRAGALYVFERKPNGGWE